MEDNAEAGGVEIAGKMEGILNDIYMSSNRIIPVHQKLHISFPGFPDDIIKSHIPYIGEVRGLAENLVYIALPELHQQACGGLVPGIGSDFNGIIAAGLPALIAQTPAEMFLYVVK